MSLAPRQTKARCRSKTSLRNRGQRARTGQSDLSPEVSEAFAINYMIRDKACLTTAHLPTTGIPHESADGTENQEEGENNFNCAVVFSNIASALASIYAAVYCSSRKDMRSKKTAAAATEQFDFQQVMAQQILRQEARELDFTFEDKLMKVAKETTKAAQS